MGIDRHHIEEKNTPEHKLWAAVLFQAIHDVRRKKAEKYSGYWQDDAKGWIQSKLQHIGSFIWICEVFDLPMKETRHLILNKRSIVLRRNYAGSVRE